MHKLVDTFPMQFFDAEVKTSLYPNIPFANNNLDTHVFGINMLESLIPIRMKTIWEIVHIYLQ
jgi:hypothetical protein